MSGWFGWESRARRVTPGEIVVVLWGATIFCVVMGAYCLWIGFHAPPEEAEYASMVKQFGVAFLVAGPLIWLGHRLIRNLMHR